jgi:hypothetical protein
MRTLVNIAPRPFREEFNKGKPKLEAAIVRGRGYKSRPAVMVCVVADRRTPLSLESAQYALYNMSLYAQVKGLGCRSLIGNQMIFNKNKEVRRRLGLKKNERIFAVAGFGYPSVKFRNKVQGKRIKVQWNDGSEDVL